MSRSPRIGDAGGEFVTLGRRNPRVVGAPAHEDGMSIVPYRLWDLVGEQLVGSRELAVGGWLTAGAEPGLEGPVEGRAGMQPGRQGWSRCELVGSN